MQINKKMNYQCPVICIYKVRNLMLCNSLMVVEDEEVEDGI